MNNETDITLEQLEDATERFKKLPNNLTSTAPERIWLHPEKQGGIPFMEHDEFPKHDEDAYEYGNTYWSEDRNHKGSVPYIRADLAGQWKPMPFPTPEDFKDGREVLLIARLEVDHRTIQPLTMMVCRWSFCHRVWLFSDNEGAGIEATPTHYFDFGTVALPTAPQAEAEEGK